MIESSDPQRVVVPDLVGLSALSARQLGHEAGLVVLGSDPDGPPTNMGLVVRQEPGSGARVAARTVVTIWVRPAGPPLRVVPDLLGLSGWEACRVGNQLGLVVIADPEVEQSTMGWHSGVVTLQRPDPGSPLRWGGFVIVWTETGPGSAGDREPRMPHPPGELRSLTSRVE